MKRPILIVLAVMLALVGCEAAMPEITEPDATVDTTVATDAPPTVDPAESEPAPTEVPPTETQAPTETEPLPTEPPPTEPPVEEPRQEGLRLNEEQLAYFVELFKPNEPQCGENYYNLILNQEFASVQDMNLIAFFEDGSPEDMKEAISQSECDYYNNNFYYSAWPPLNVDRLSYNFISDVFQRYLGLYIPDMDMSTLIYNPSTGCYYRAGSGTYKHHTPKFTDGYYNEETGLLYLYYDGGSPVKERIVTLRYKPEAENIKFLIVSCLPADYPEPRQEGVRLGKQKLNYLDWLLGFNTGHEENYYSYILNQDIASVQDIDLAVLFRDGSPEDMKEAITQSECDYYNKLCNSDLSSKDIDRLSYDFVNDVLQRYLGLTIPEMDMSTLVYNSETGYYYRADSGSYQHAPYRYFKDGYYNKETGLFTLYYADLYQKDEGIVTLRYKPEAEVTQFQVVSCLPVDSTASTTD